MFDKTDYWLELCDDDLRTANNLFESKEHLWMAFLCYYVVKKSLMASMVNENSEKLKQTSDLIKLAKQANLIDSLTVEQVALLNELTPYYIETRYPSDKEARANKFSSEYCNNLLMQTKNFLRCSKHRLGKQ